MKTTKEYKTSITPDELKPLEVIKTNDPMKRLFQMQYNPKKVFKLNRTKYNQDI